MTKSRFKPTKKALIFWTLFIGIGAIFGSLCMIIDPSGKIMGMDKMLPYFQKLPFADKLFQNFLFSGIMLLLVNGLTNICAFILIILNKKLGLILGGVFGVTLMLWISIQFYMFPFNFMSTIYFIFGFIQAITGYMAFVFYKQETFVFDINDYSNINTNNKNIVIYFSRMGYVKKKAYEAANESGAEILEIKALEKTEGTLGFWWCGRFGMHHFDMPIAEISIDLSKYEHVTICTPIWVFSLASPVRTFCKKMSGKINEVDYILVHHTNGEYKNVVNEMDELLKLENTHYKSISCKMGKYKIIKK